MDIGQRVKFSERQRLRVGDLQAEQAYMLGLAGRHHLGPHQWGIVRGLGLSVEEDHVTIMPGVAIDGYGRELVLSKDVSRAIEGPNETCYVYLYYCERPQGGCSPAPPSRWHDSAEITVSPEPWPVPIDNSSMVTARAAGHVGGASPWPILLGVISGDPVDPPIARLRAARVLSLSGHALLQIGQENRADPYHVRVFERDATGTMKNRFAVDRDGNPTLWGDLTLTGTGRNAYIQMGEKLLKLTIRSGAGGPIKYRVLPIKQGVGKKVILRDSEGHEESYEFRAKALAGDCKKCKRESRMIEIEEIGSGQGEKKVQGRQSKFEQESVLSTVVDDREQSFEYDGGNLSFESEEGQSSSMACGCESEERPQHPPEGLLFYPGQAPPKSPSYDVQYLNVTPSDKPPVNELRVSGGAFKDGDISRRVTVGWRPTDQGPFAPWLTMRGNGTIQLLGADASMKAIGTVQLSPIKPDPRDPLFNYLTVFAFTQGVASLNSSLIDAIITDASFDDKAKQLKYRLTVTNKSLTEPMVLEQGVAIIVGTSSFAWIQVIEKVKGTSLGPGALSPFPATHDLKGAPSTRQFVLKVTVTAKIGPLTVAHTTTPVTVKVPPSDPVIN